MISNSTRPSLKLFVFLVILATALGSTSYAQNSNEDPTTEEDEGSWSSLEYPELQVQPPATQRLLMEAQSESRSANWQAHWPIQISSLMLLGASLKAQGNYAEHMTNVERDQLNTAVGIAQGVSGFWIGTTLALSAAYKPYAKGASRIAFKPRNRRQALSRERWAEETLEGAHDLAWKLSWISTTSHLVASLYLAEQATSENKPYAEIAALGSLMPLIFKSPWIKNWRIHKTYKKRIYGPIGEVTPSWTLSASGGLTPLMNYRISW